MNIFYFVENVFAEQISLIAPCGGTTYTVNFCNYLITYRINYCMC